MLIHSVHNFWKTFLINTVLFGQATFVNITLLQTFIIIISDFDKMKYNFKSHKLRLKVHKLASYISFYQKCFVLLYLNFRILSFTSFYCNLHIPIPQLWLLTNQKPGLWYWDVKVVEKNMSNLKSGKLGYKKQTFFEEKNNVRGQVGDL